MSLQDIIDKTNDSGGNQPIKKKNWTTLASIYILLLLPIVVLSFFLLLGFLGCGYGGGDTFCSIVIPVSFWSWLGQWVILFVVTSRYRQGKNPGIWVAVDMLIFVATLFLIGKYIH